MPGPDPSSGPVFPAESEPGRSRPVPPELVVLAFVAAVVGLLTRLIVRSGLWLDEALTVSIASLPVDQIVDALRRDGHPPAHYVLLHFWMELFGEGDAAVRSLSVVFGMGALVLLAVIARRLGGPELAVIVVIVLSLSAFAVRYSSETRMYSLVMLLVTVGWLLLDDLLRRGRVGVVRLVGLALVTAALLYTHYWSIWLLGAVGLMLIALVWRGEGASRRPPLLALGAIGVGSIAFLPWLPVMLHQLGSTGTPWATATRPTTALAYTLADLGAGLYSDAAMVAIVVAVLILLAVFGVAAGRRRILLELTTVPQVRPEAVGAALTFLLGTLAAFATGSAFATRYTAVIVPLLVVLVAAGLTRFEDRVLRSIAVYAVAGLFVVGAGWNVLDTRTQSVSLADRIITVSEERTPGEGALVVACPDQLSPSLARALSRAQAQAQSQGPENSVPLSGPVRVLPYPTLGDPAFVDWTEYAERNAVADPDAVATEILRMADPGQGIFLVWNGTYRTFEGQCEELLGALASQRVAETLVDADGDRWFEHASLVWFAPQVER